jgi:hypothetical protein
LIDSDFAEISAAAAEELPATMMEPAPTSKQTRDAIDRFEFG